jgi:D-arabinitol dehydrogenase (NADP+)
MKAIVFREGVRWAVEEVDDPRPGPDDVVLRVLRTGLCGTDEHLLHGGFIAKLPLIPGHEMVGEVIAAGSAVTDRPVGTKVVVDNATYCGRCDACANGAPLFCENFHSLGCNAPGGFAEQVLVRADKTYPIGDLDVEVAVLTEPLACALHGMDVLDPPIGANALVLGAGPTGLLLAQLLRMSGAAAVTVAAPTASKLEVANGLGIEHVVQLVRGDPAAAVPALRAIAPRGFDVVIEATGAVELLEVAPSLTRTGGTVMVYGVAPEDATARIRPYEVFSRELTLKGSFAQANCIERALFILQSGRISNAGIITARVGFDTFGDAIANLHDSAQVKTVFVPAG